MSLKGIYGVLCASMTRQTGGSVPDSKSIKNLLTEEPVLGGKPLLRKQRDRGLKRISNQPAFVFLLVHPRLNLVDI